MLTKCVKMYDYDASVMVFLFDDSGEIILEK